MKNVIIKLIFFTSIVSILNTSGILWASSHTPKVSSIIVKQQNGNYEYHNKNFTGLENITLIKSVNNFLKVLQKDTEVLSNKYDMIYHVRNLSKHPDMTTQPGARTVYKIEVSATPICLSDLLSNPNKNLTNLTFSKNETIALSSWVEPFLNSAYAKNTEEIMLSTSDNNLLILTIENSSNILNTKIDANKSTEIPSTSDNNLLIPKTENSLNILNTKFAGNDFAGNDPIEVSSMIVNQDNEYQYHDTEHTLLDSTNLHLSDNKKNLIEVSSIIVHQNNQYQYHQQATRFLNGINLKLDDNKLIVLQDSQELTSIEVKNMHNAIIFTSPITDNTSELNLTITHTFLSLSDLLQNNKKSSSKVKGILNQIIKIHTDEAGLLKFLQNQENSPATLLIHTENNDLLVIEINKDQGIKAPRRAGLPYTDKGKKESTDVSILNTSGILFSSSYPSIEVSSIIVQQDNKYHYQSKTYTSRGEIKLVANNNSLQVFKNTEQLNSIEVKNIYNATITTNQITQSTSKLNVKTTPSTLSLSDLLKNKKEDLSEEKVQSNLINEINDRDALILSSLISEKNKYSQILVQTKTNDLLVIEISIDKKQNSWFFYGVPIIGILAILIAAYYFIKIK